MWFRNHAPGSLVDRSRPAGLEITRSPFRAASRSALPRLLHAGALVLRPFARPRATHRPQGRGDDQALDRPPPYRSHMPAHTAALPRIQQLCIRVQATHRPGAVSMPKRPAFSDGDEGRPRTRESPATRGCGWAAGKHASGTVSSRQQQTTSSSDEGTPTRMSEEDIPGPRNSGSGDIE